MLKAPSQVDGICGAFWGDIRNGSQGQMHVGRVSMPPPGACDSFCQDHIQNPSNYVLTVALSHLANARMELHVQKWTRQSFLGIASLRGFIVPLQLAYATCHLKA